MRQFKGEDAAFVVDGVAYEAVPAFTGNRGHIGTGIGRNRPRVKPVRAVGGIVKVQEALSLDSGRIGIAELIHIDTRQLYPQRQQAKHNEIDRGLHLSLPLRAVSEFVLSYDCFLHKPRWPDYFPTKLPSFFVSGCGGCYVQIYRLSSGHRGGPATSSVTTGVLRTCFAHILMT